MRAVLIPTAKPTAVYTTDVPVRDGVPPTGLVYAFADGAVEHYHYIGTVLDAEVGLRESTASYVEVAHARTAPRPAKEARH